MSSKFKTHSKFGFQPVTTNSVSQNLIKRYVEDIRPQIVRTMQANQITEAEDALFLRYDGKVNHNGGTMVIQLSYFRIILSCM